MILICGKYCELKPEITLLTNANRKCTSPLRVNGLTVEFFFRSDKTQNQLFVAIESKNVIFFWTIIAK